MNAIIPLDPSQPRKGRVMEITAEKKDNRKSMTFSSLFGIIKDKEKKKSHENLKDLISAPSNFEYFLG